MPHSRSKLWPARAVSRTLAVSVAFALSALGATVLAALPKVPEGFEIHLVAAVPAVQFPCQVATSPDGALFVAEDPMDQIGPPDKPVDRILIFREGKEPVVFAETLNAVFGMVWHDGSLYVMNMPNLTVLKDTDGDGKADQRKEIFTDLGLPAGQPNMFNDHIVSGLQIGIDGYLYISVGDKGIPKVTGPDGRTAQIFGGGTLRCRLDGTQLEVFTNGTRNHLEPNLDDRDNLFTYDNTDDGLGWWTRVTHHIDGGFYGYPWDYHDRTDRMLNRMAEYGGGSPCGGVVYKEDAWPEAYRGKAFWAEWAKRNVRMFGFEPQGSTFKVGTESDFAQPDTVSDFRPLDLALSYDGKTMYIADWGYGGWANKTEKLGRVYAVTYTGTIKQEPRGTDADPIDAQIKALAHPSFNERFRAQTALTKKGHEALQAVTAALADAKTGPVAKRHLIWVLDAIAGGTPQATTPTIEALKSNIADIRAQAARALGIRADAAAVGPLTSLLADPEPSVKLQALIALGRIGRPEPIAAILPMLADSDPYLAFSARKALRRIGDWKVAAVGLKSPKEEERLALLLAMEMVYETDAAQALARYVDESDRSPAERAKALYFLAQGFRKQIPWDGKWWGTQPAKTERPAKTIDWSGTPFVLKTIRDHLSDPSAPIRLTAVMATASTKDPEAVALLRKRFESETDADVKSAIANAFGKLGDQDALPLLIAAMKDANAPESVRDATLASVETIGSEVALKGLLDLLESGTLATDRQPRVVSALGRFKSESASVALIRSLKNNSAAVRAAAADAIGKVGKKETAAAPLRALLTDAAEEVQKSAIAALGALKDTEAVEALITAANTEKTSFEASNALAAMPDARALSVYLRGLADKSGDLRRASSTAIASLRDNAAPFLQKLADRKELNPAALPELRKIFASVKPILDWQVLGEFPIKARQPFSVEKPVDLTVKYPGFKDDPIGWKSVKASPRGEVDLTKHYNADNELAVFAYAEIDSPNERKASFNIGSDDTLTVWINGEKVYDFQDSRSYSPDAATFDAGLVSGKNRILVKCGNHGGPWAFSVAVSAPADYAFLKGAAPGAFDPENYRQFALKGTGKVEHGKALFADLKGLACLKCHAVSGQGGLVGPELTSVGAKYPKEELIASVLYPSAKISSGYEPVLVATTDGKIITGIIKGETPDAIEIEDADAKRQKIAKADIDERKRSDISIMPNGLAEGLTPQDFADLIAYLETLKDVKK